MNNYFLHKVANHIKLNNLLSPKNIVILPSHRASLFLKKELIELVDQAVFLPQFVSIETFTQNLTNLRLIDNVNLQFELFDVYKNVVAQNKQDSFDKFIQWAPIVLQDFNEIDGYLTDANSIFKNLGDFKRLENWFPNQKPSALSINYLNFFEILNNLYTMLYKRLLNKQVAYQGLIYREAVKNISKFSNQFKGKLIFCGFNALNKAEEVIIQDLLMQKKAEIFWDVDKTLLNKNHTAIKFINRYKNNWPYYKNNPFNWISSNLKIEKKITIIGAPKQVAQLKVAGQILENLEKVDNQFSNTTLVLGNEQLLNVALESLPTSVKKVNITMGYALQNTPLAALFLNLFNANLNALKMNKSDSFYYEDFQAIWQNPYLNKVLKLNSKILTDFVFKNNLRFVDFNNLKEKLSIKPNEFDFIFENTGGDISKFLNNCIKLLNLFKENNNFSVLENEYFYNFTNLFLELQSLENKYNFIVDLKTLFHFYLTLLRSEKLYFKGEPLQGLQIMGMLETRTLDFKNLIITSVNEGVLPASKSSTSFLPLALKRAFGLPTYQDKDNIYAYHFFRLIQRAENIYLIYNTEVDDFGASEKSRFITQLELLKPKDVVYKTAISSVESKLLKPIEVEVDKTIKERLKQLALSGLSPSAIDLYLRNPIDFYFSKILNINDLDTIENTIAQNTFGTVIHNSLFDLYKPFEGKLLTLEKLEKTISNIEVVLNINAEKGYKNGNITSGKNKLYFEMAKQYLNKLLKHEISLIKKGHSIKILTLETKLKTVIKIEGINYPITLKGVADRIDEFDGKTRIIDYKTGVVEAGKLKVKNFEILSQNENYSKALQLLIYAYIYSKSDNINKSFEAGIISFKRLNKYILKLSFEDKNYNNYNITQQKLTEFEPVLKSLIKSILTTEKFIEKI